jgi:hypothetical protein
LTRRAKADLSAHDPALAERFRDLRAQLGEGEPTGNESVTALRLQLRRRDAAADALETLLAEVRALPGFESFLGAPRLEALLPAHPEEFAVLINVSAVRSDAIVLVDDGVHVVGLPALLPADVRNAAETLTAASDPATLDAALPGILRWLWDAVTGPVLEWILERQGDPTEPPRVWWCAGGLLATLPIHAAGHHEAQDDRGPRTVVDLAKSSYAPTLRMRSESHRRHAADADEDAGVLVVAMPRTPDAGDLPGAAREAKTIRDAMGHRRPVTVLEGADREEVLGRLPAYGVAHFACHGVSDLARPSASRLLLDDHEHRPLTVSDISALDIARGELAFLSACSSAAAGVALPDEVIHLSSAFRLAGYRHVIGTLWPIDDHVAADIAAAVYRDLAKAAGPPDFAGSLREQLIALRESHPDRPSIWASHVHLGP